jgi:hypothetical protein
MSLSSQLGTSNKPLMAAANRASVTSTATIRLRRQRASVYSNDAAKGSGRRDQEGVSYIAIVVRRSRVATTHRCIGDSLAIP